ncbi:MAG: T9SS type A sorting domain-containing protein, partial [Bacteroidota bacterium]
LLHPAKSGGGHIMRNCTLINLFNGFRTRPERISEDGNIEIYENEFINIRDNDFEPEGWAWNIHYHHNRHFNIHKAYSIDDVRGGNIYIFGNTHYQSKDAWALDEVSGIFKYKDGPLSYPCYAFNNSYYTEAKVLKSGEATNHLLKHFNNAYYFFQGSDRFRLDAWQPGYEFDYDCINQNWTRNITNNQQEQHGLEFTDPLFVDGANGNFQLQPTSLCIDAGKTMTLPELQWSQRFTGVAPDIGAYEGTQPTNGPPFRFIPSPEGTFYEELPRISQHLVADSTLILYFSAPLDTTAITTTDLLLFGSGTKIPVQEITFPNHAYEMYVTANQALSTEQLSLLFAKKPMGKNGLPFTYWGATIPIGESLRPLPDLSQVKALITSVTSVNLAPATLSIFPNPVRAGGSFVVSLPTFEKPTSDVFLQILSTNGQLLRTVELHDIRQEQFAIQLADELPQGVYVVRLEGWAGSHIGKLVVGQ